MDDTIKQTNQTQTGKADRMPTPDEERTAEQMSDDVDREQVAEHYDEMAELGASVRGEGEILPNLPPKHSGQRPGEDPGEGDGLDG